MKKVMWHIFLGLGVNVIIFLWFGVYVMVWLEILGLKK